MKLDFAVLRNRQGIYAPLHLQNELDVANRVNAVSLLWHWFTKCELSTQAAGMQTELTL